MTIKQKTAMTAMLLLVSGCTTITSTQTRPDGTIDHFSFTSGSSKTVFKGLKTPGGVNIGSFGTDISDQLAPIIGQLGSIAAQMQAAQLAAQSQQFNSQQSISFQQQKPVEIQLNVK